MPETRGSIKGIVRDSESNKPLSGVLVNVVPHDKESKTTISDGAYTFTDLESKEYTVTFQKKGYESGEKKTDVKAGKESTVDYSMNPIPPVMSVSTSNLDFGSTESSLAFSVISKGENPLNWRIDEDIEWLSCTPSSGTITNSSASVKVAVDRSKLDDGNYNDLFIVTSDNPKIAQQTVRVSISVNKSPLQVSPSELDFGSDKNSIDITLKNNGTGTICYSVISSNNWLMVNKTSGSVSNVDYLTALVSRDGLAPNSYSSSLIFTVDGKQIAIPVKMDIVSKDVPSVSLESVSDVTYESAKCNGVIKSLGYSKIIKHGFVWNDTPSPTVETGHVISLGDCNEPKSFTGMIIGLNPSTKYYVRAFAQNNQGIAYSQTEQSFTTNEPSTVPGVETRSVSNITTTSAVANGYISSLGNVSKITQYGHVWGTSPQPSLSNAAHSDLGSASSTKEFSSHINSLAAGATYYVRAYAVNSEGTSYGEDVSFTTNDYEAPTVSIGTVSNLQSKSVSINGTIVSIGGIEISEHGHCWSTSPNPTIADNKTTLGSCSVEYSYCSNITGLSAGTTYYVRAYATNTRVTSYSNQITITTPEAEANKWDGEMASSFAGGSGTSIDPYVIETGAQLVLMKKYSDKYFIIKNDIDLDNRSWPSFDFRGKLNGNGCTISNLKITKTDANLGLFSTLYGEVKNLNIVGVNIQAKGTSNVGAIAGLVYETGVIKDCTVTIKNGSIIWGNNNVGGIAGTFGEIYNGIAMTISNCSVYSDAPNNVIIGNSGVGGIIGYANNKYYKIYVENCHASVNIACGKNAGGICGGSEWGNIIYFNNCSFAGSISGESNIGGIFGSSDDSSSSTTQTHIYACKTNVSIVVSDDYAGGIVADHKGGHLYGVFYSSYSMGTISSKNSNASHLGGICATVEYEIEAHLCYSTISSSHNNFDSMYGGSNSRFYGYDCASIAPYSNDYIRGSNCNLSCDNITEFLHSCYSNYASYYNFNNTWTWTGTINGQTVNVSCPKLSWEK